MIERSLGRKRCPRLVLRDNDESGGPAAVGCVANEAEGGGKSSLGKWCIHSSLMVKGEGCKFRSAEASCLACEPFPAAGEDQFRVNF